MNMCLDCKHLIRGFNLEDNICGRPGAGGPMAARERYSRAANACTQFGKFFQPAEDRAIGRKEWGDDI